MERPVAQNALSPQVVDRAVTFVDDDDIEEFGRQFWIVNDWQGFFADLSSLSRVSSSAPSGSGSSFRIEYMRCMVEMQIRACGEMNDEFRRWTV